MIRILTNEVAGGWEGEGVEKGLGGSEESVVYLAIALQKHYQTPVCVYHTQKTPSKKIYQGVTFESRENFISTDNDIVIMFKVPLRSVGNFPAKQILHWSCEVEKPRQIGSISHFVNPSDYLKGRHFWVPESKNIVIPFGCDFDGLESNRVTRIPNQILYCSSPDRGLLHLLRDWATIKKVFPKMSLVVAYGFEQMLSIMGDKAKPFVKTIMEMLNQKDIKYVGHQNKKQIEQLYYQSQYWVLPLDNPDSELFCLNAVKAQYAGCLPIVHRIGALKNTVGNHFPYHKFRAGILTLQSSNCINVLNWSDTVEKYWSEIINL